MNSTNLITALAPAFAGGFAVQRLLEILDPLTDYLASVQKKKILLGLSSLIAGLGLAAGLGVRVLAPLGAKTSTSPFGWLDLLDLLVTGLVISAGTEGFNSILKFMTYKKEEKKEEATTKAVTATTTKALLAGRLKMACNYTPDEIEGIVVDVYRKQLDDNSITRFSRFGPGKEIDIDGDARRAFFFPIKQNVDRPPDCVITKLTPEDVQSAKTVGEIIDAIVDEFEIG